MHLEVLLHTWQGFGSGGGGGGGEEVFPPLDLVCLP